MSYAETVDDAEHPQPGDLYMRRSFETGTVDVILILSIGGEYGGIVGITYAAGSMHRHHWTWESGKLVEHLKKHYELVPGAR